MSKISEILNDPHYAKTLITENEFLWSDGTPKDTRTLEEIQEEHYKTLDYNKPGYKYQKPCVIAGTHIGREPIEIPYAKCAQDNLEFDEKIVGEHKESLIRKWAPMLEKINSIKPLLYREKVNLAKLFEWKVNSGIVGEEFTKFFDDLCVTVKSDHMEDILVNDIINDITDAIGKNAADDEFHNDSTKDMVHHPSHYDNGDSTYEPYKVISAWKKNFNIGSAIKYLARYEKKWNPIEDLEKAKQYIDFEIEKLNNEKKHEG